MDGSRGTAPRTKSNEQKLCAPNYGTGQTAKYRGSKKGKKKKKHCKNETKLMPPQMWITLIWHVGLGIPWDWKLGPSNSSERDHVKSKRGTEANESNLHHAASRWLKKQMPNTAPPSRHSMKPWQFKILHGAA
jgi:hypothetical protein